MDFMNLLRSAELLLYEVVSWIVFYPLTLWRSIRHPLAMMGYAERELRQPPEAQFDDALSPPIFLFLTLVLVHLLQTLVFHQAGLHGVLGDTRNLLVFRAVSFSMFPMLLGVQHVRLAGLPLRRATLQPMFYAQCYVTVPFVLVVDLALLTATLKPDWTKQLSLVMFVAGVAWYSAVLRRGFMVHRGVTPWMATGQTVLALVVGTAVLIAAMLLALMTAPFSTAQ